MGKFETLAWPRADQSIQQPTQDIMQKLITEVRALKDQLQENWSTQRKVTQEEQL